MLSPKMFRSRKSSESNITIDKEKDKDLESKKNRSSSSQSNIKRSSHKSQESIPVSKASSGENLIFGDAIFKTKKPVQEYFRQNIDETKKNIARDQDLDSLLTLLQFEQMEIRYLASEIIQGLSVNDEGLKLSENAWSSLGLLARNVDDSMEHSDTILTEVSWTLLTLASHMECHKDFITFIEWSTLLRLTNCDHVIIKSNVCSLLGYLALNGISLISLSNFIDELSLVVAKNFLDLLIFSGKVTSHIEVKETVSTTLANLSLNEENARKICDKAIDMLVLWLMDPNEVKLALGAVNTITNIILVGDEKRNRLFVERNGLFPLSKLLQVNNVDILKTVTVAISLLASHHDLHPKFIQLGVVDILISLAKSPSLDESILMGVCLAIHNLVENIDSRREMLRSVNLVDLLFELMKKRSSEKIEQQANKTILLLSSEPKYTSSRSSRDSSDLTVTSSDESSQDEIESPYLGSSSSSSLNSEPSLSRSGSFGPLANAGVYWRVKRPSSLPGSLSDISKSGSLSRISDISDTSDSLYPGISTPEIPLTLGILSELVSSLESNPDIISTFIKREHVAKLKQLARLNVSRQVQYANHGAYDVIPSLVLLLFCSDEKIKSLALDAVTLFADSNEANQTRVLNSQGLKIIQDLVFVGNVGNADYISMKAIGALASLSTNNKKVSKEIRESGVVMKLIDLLRNVNVQKNAIIALCAFADTDSESQMYIIKNGGVPVLISLLNDANAEVVTLAISAITAIVKYNVKGQSLLMGTKGCFAILVGLLDSKQVEVQSQVCALIMELCRENEKCQKMFWEEKVADPLLNILQSLEVNKGDLIYNASGAVWVLSGKKKRRKYFVERGGLVALQTLHKKLGPTNQKSSIMKAVDQTIAILSKDKKKSFIKM